jgi:hypothetical protein
MDTIAQDIIYHNPIARTRPELTLTTWQLITTIAPIIHQSRLFGVNSPEQASAIMLKGHELGLGLAASFEYINVIQNKPTLSPRGALALVLASGLLTDMHIDEQPGRCTATMQRGPITYAVTWTIEDAKKAGIIKPDGAWTTYQANMLRWRAIGFVLDVLFPDITGGLKRADEFGAPIDNDGNVLVVATAPEHEAETVS